MTKSRGHATAWDRVEALARATPGAEVSVAARLVGTDRAWRLDAERVFPAASIIKTAILVALYRDVDAGRLDLATSVPVPPDAKVKGTGVLTWMSPDLTLPLADIAYLMIAISDNTASNVLIDTVGLPRIQATIADLGLTSTALNRRFLGRRPGSHEPENVTHAADQAALLGAIAGDTAASPRSCQQMRATLALQQDRDRIARYLPDGLTFAGKSGTLPGLIHDTGLIETPAGTLALAVLTRGLPDDYQAAETIGRIAQTIVAGFAAP